MVKSRDNKGMNGDCKRFGGVTGLLAALLMGGCAGLPQSSVSTAADWQLDTRDTQVLDRVFLGDSQRQLKAVEGMGLQWQGADTAKPAFLPGNFEALDSRPMPQGDRWLFATTDVVTQQVMAGLVGDDGFSRRINLPAQPYEVSGVCLHRSADADLFLFLVSESGVGSQWLLGNGAELLSEARLVRHLPLPPMAQFCEVDDAYSELLVNEEGVGFWSYPAAAEAETQRRPLALVQPFGALTASAGNLTLVEGGVVLMDPAAGQLHTVQRKVDGWALRESVSLPDLVGDPEQLRASLVNGQLEVSVRDDDSGQWWQHATVWSPDPSDAPAAIPVARAAVETQPVAGYGDAADDPAVWVNQSDPQRSLVLGTDKKAGLQVYGLDGTLRQSLNIGRLNNVDVRSGVVGQNGPVTLAAASHRDTNSISLFRIDESSLAVSHVSDISTPLSDIYGLCLYQPSPQRLYAFANDKDGRVLQYQIDANSGSGREVRRFSVASQPEGCVADDRGRRLFIGEEDVGVWVVAAEPDAGTDLSPVIQVGAELHADVEGLALYHRNGDAQWLVISSQGNDSYLVVDAQPPYAVKGVFRVAADASAGIDGASETDGLEVVSANLGGVWSQGMLVVQDGRNRMPEEPQNFKLVPWAQVQTTLKLNEKTR